VHHERGLSCIDCHVHTEVMGDGIAHAHKEDQVEITCESCHGPHDEPAAPWAAVADDISRDIVRLRDREPGARELVHQGRRGTPLWNLRSSPAGPVLLGKGDGKPHPVTPTPADLNHQLPGHERLSCSSCHSAWAPWCATCHTRYEPDGRQWDFGRARETAGAWVESADGYGWGEPALAVRADDRIVPAIPGMMLTIQSAAGQPPLRRRLFAAIDPHTTRTQARSCASCHRSARALGWGSGELDFDPAEPRFVPASPNPAAPSRAQDGWTEPYPEPPGAGTRTGLRSLDATEQRAVLLVGRCLPCHESVGDPVYRGFSRALAIWRSGEGRCPDRPTTSD
jgi:hypothetical protein